MAADPDPTGVTTAQEVVAGIQALMADMPAPRAYSGRGVVTLAGGLLYFLNAYLSVSLLRHLGCQLPVEWFYLSGEMSQEMLGLAAAIPGVACRELQVASEELGGQEKRVKTEPYYKNHGGWQAKTWAVLESSFCEVLWQDADCFALVDPSQHFDLAGYRETGALFTPDVRRWRDDVEGQGSRTEWPRGLGLPLRPDDWQHETGQFLLDKGRNWDALVLAHWLNRCWRWLYEIPGTIGDKDVYYWGFRFVGREPAMCETPGAAMGGLVHGVTAGEPAWLHLVGGGKWWFDGRCAAKPETFPHWAFCRATLADLMQRWSCCLE